MTDLSDTVAPKSDQMDAEDLHAGPLTFTVKEVRRASSAEQPIDVHLNEFERPWRPAKTVRRILIAAWGSDGAKYVGRRLTLFCDPTVKFGGIAVGGIRVSHMSDLPDGKPLKVVLMETKGKRAQHTGAEQ